VAPPIILATQEAVQSQPREIVCETLSSKNPLTKKVLVEWLKVKVLSSNPVLQKKKKCGGA
jgi:hypothetical protein